MLLRTFQQGGIRWVRQDPHIPSSSSSHRAWTRLPNSRRPALLPEQIDSVLTSATVASSIIAVVVTASACIASPPQRMDSKEEEETFEWSVMGVVSCIPLFSFVAWLMPVISRPSPSNNLYYMYCALYCAPLLRSGFSFDGYSLLMLALCITHVQIERLVNTEPETLQNLQLLSGPARLLNQLTSGTASLPSGLAQLQKSLPRPAGGRDEEDVYRGPSPSGLQAGAKQQEGEGMQSLEGSEAELELKQFDRRLIERDKRRSGRSAAKHVQSGSSRGPGVTGSDGEAG